MRKNFGVMIFMLLTLTVLTAFTVSLFGRYEISPKDNVSFILSRIGILNIDISNAKFNLLSNIRYPRIIACILIGAGLSISGATYQAIFKNPLVSPDLLGVSQGAGVGAAISIILDLPYFYTEIFSLIFGLFAVFVANFLPRLLKNNSTLMLVLSGIIVSGFMSSTLGLLKYLADPETQLPAIVYWQMGSLSSIRKTSVLSVIIPMTISFLILIMIRWRINILSLGDEEAQLLGINVKFFRGLSIICATVLTACSVCISGTIGWIGLIIPHIARILSGSDNAKVLPVSLFTGAIFMMIVDTFARTVSQSEVPISIVTGFVGAPLYFYLLSKQKVRIG